MDAITTARRLAEPIGEFGARFMLDPATFTRSTELGLPASLASYVQGRIGVMGELDTATDAAELRDSFDIQPGEYLQSDTILAEQFDLDRALGETGYAFAEIDEPELLIDHDRVEGDLTMPVRPNGKYVFAAS